MNRLIVVFTLLLVTAWAIACSPSADLDLGTSAAGSGPLLPPLELGMVTPPRAPNAGGIRMSLLGQGFMVGARVFIGGVEATEVTVLSGTRLTAVLPRALRTLGGVPVDVRNPDGQAVHRGDLFEYHASHILFPSQVFAGEGVQGMAAADLDEDGGLDLITAHASDQIKVSLNDGIGGFAKPTTFTVYAPPALLAPGDFDGDGHLDLAVGYSVSTNLIGVLFGDGTGSLAPPIDVAVFANPSTLLVEDINKDGKQDILIHAGTDVAAMISNGRGFDMAVKTRIGSASSKVAIGDFNSDGKPDVITADPPKKMINLWLGDGMGNWAPALPFAVSATPGRIVVADVNQDQKLDFVVSFPTSLNVFLGNGMGGFGGPTAVASLIETAPSLHAGDVNGDQQIDLLIASSRDDTLRVFFGDGRGAFPERWEAPSANSINTPAKALIADLNQDQRPDLAIIGAGEGLGAGVTVWWGGAQGRPILATKLSVHSESFAVETADFDGDQKPDLVTLADPSFINIVLSNGTRGPRTVEIDAGLRMQGLVVGDWNGDQQADFAVSHNSDDKVSLFLGDGTGSFSGPMQLAAGIAPIKLAAGDWNGDARLDLAVENYATKDISLFLNDGRGGFAAPTRVFVGGFPRDLAAADLNADGKLDLIVPNSGSNRVGVLLGDGAGGFSAQVEFAAGIRPHAVVVGDLNGDRKLDLITSNEGSGDISVLLGAGDGSFSPPVHFPATLYNKAIRAADFNGDGNLDVVVVGYYAQLQIHQGNGAGGFFPPIVFAGRECPNILTVDYDSDRKPDIIFPNDNKLFLLSNFSQ